MIKPKEHRQILKYRVFVKSTQRHVGDFETLSEVAKICHAGNSTVSMWLAGTRNSKDWIIEYVLEDVLY